MKAARSYLLKTLALSILALLVLGAGAILAFLISKILSTRDQEVAQSIERLARYEAEIQSRPRLEAELQRLVRQSAAFPGLVPGTSAPLAAANIQSEIKNIITRNAGEIRSSQNLPPSAADGVEKIEVAYDITLSANHLKDLIHQIETHTPYFFLDSINIQAPSNSQSLKSDGSPPKLEVHWVVRGYRWTGSE